MTYFVFFWTTKDCQIKRLCGFPAYKTAEDYPTASNSKKDTKLIQNLHSSIILLSLIASERFFDEICRQIEEKKKCLTTVPLCVFNSLPSVRMKDVWSWIIYTEIKLEICSN